MLLIMMRQSTTEVINFGNEAKTITTHGEVSFATRKNLNHALLRILYFRDQFNKEFGDNTIDYRLLSVSEVEDIPDPLLEDLKLKLAERL